MSDFRSERLAASRNYRELNRKRARIMEKKLATYLKGKRVPFSGAGSIKGDVLAQGVLVECKLTEQYGVIEKTPMITLKIAQLEKIHKEAQSMAVLGIHSAALAFHYHETPILKDGVLMRKDFIERFCPTIDTLCPPETVFVVERRTFIIGRKSLLRWLENRPIVYIDTPIGTFGVMFMSTFRDLIMRRFCSEQQNEQHEQNEQSEQSNVSLTDDDDDAMYTYFNTDPEIEAVFDKANTIHNGEPVDTFLYPEELKNTDESIGDSIGKSKEEKESDV